MKTRKMLSLAILFSALAIVAMYAPHARAETVNCTPIDHLPYTISSQGVYCFTQNLATSMTSGNAITINTNNVVIDLNGFKLGGLRAGAGTSAIGIFAYQRQNITIRNGTVRGFLRGIFLDDVNPFTTSQGHLIEDLRADLNTFMGIYAQGTGVIIRNCQVVKTGGSTLFNRTMGIAAIGPGNRIINNDVSETVQTITSHGIYLELGDGAVVERNRVSNAALGTDTSTGIRIYSSSRVIVNDNSISTMDYGIYYYDASGLYSNNRTSGCTTPFTGGTPAGSTNYHD